MTEDGVVGLASIHSVEMVLADGTALGRWQSWEVDTDIRKIPSTQWRCTFGPATNSDVREVRDFLRLNPVVQIKVCGTPIATGRVVDRETYADRDNGSILNVSGADALGSAVKACLPIGFQAHGEQSVRELITQAVQRWGIETITDASLDRRAITARRVVRDGITRDIAVEVDASGTTRYREEDVLPAGAREVETRQSRELHGRPGETVLAWLQRLLEQHRLSAWTTADGRLFVGRPDYDQPILMTIERVVGSGPPTEGSIIDGGLIERDGDQFGKVTVVGRVGRQGRTAIRAEATDEDLLARGWDSELIVTDESLRDQAAAEAKALQLLRESQVSAREYHCTLAGLGIGAAMPAPDTMCAVQDEDADVFESLYCVARKFKCDRDAAPVSSLVFIRPNLWGV